MNYKRYTFKFKNTVSCFGDHIAEDDIIATSLEQAKAICKREYHHGIIDSITVSPTSVFDQSDGFTLKLVDDISELVEKSTNSQLALSEELP